MKKQFKWILSRAVAALLAVTTVVTASQQGPVDLEGPQYHGNVIMAENLNGTIDSMEALSLTEPIGIPKGAAGTPKPGGSAASEAPVVRCHTAQNLQKASEAPELAQIEERDAGVQREYQLGDTRLFYDENGQSLTIEMASEGETCTIWRDQAHPEMLSDDLARDFAEIIDTRIHDKMAETFGGWDHLDVDRDGKTAFVFYNIPYSGLFNPADLFTPEEYAYASGNVMDALHIGVRDLDQPDIILATMVHELQHLINYANTGGSCEVWINEMMSQSAIAVTELANEKTVFEVNALSDLIDETGYSGPFIFTNMFVPEGGPLSSAAYGSWYLFGRYLAAQTEGFPGGGDQIYQTILKAAGEDGCHFEDIGKALETVGYLGEGQLVSDIETFVTNYNTALYLRAQEGVYALGDDPEDSNRVDGVQVRPVFPIRYALEELPGGGAASWSLAALNVTEPAGFGEHLRFAGITSRILDGVYLENSGIFTVGEPLELKSNDGETEIYYTTDGSDPITNGLLYTEPLTVDHEMTLKACTRDRENHVSRVSSWEIRVKAGDVIADPPSGSIVPGQKITLTTDTPDADIYYTTDGTEPSETNGTRYQEPISVSETLTLKAVAVMTGQAVLPGTVKTFTYETGYQGDRYELNNTLESATALSFPGIIQGTLHDAKDLDYYRIQLDHHGTAQFTLMPPAGQSYELMLMDQDGQLIDKGHISRIRTIRKALQAGDYILCVKSRHGSASELNPYELSMTWTKTTAQLQALDYSEMNMLTALTDHSDTGSGGAWDLGVNGGGHFLMSSAYYTRWQGPVDESEDPFRLDSDFKYKDLSDQSQVHVQNILYLPNNDRTAYIEHLKNAIYSYGAADIFIQSAGSYFTPDYKNLYVDPTYQYQTPNDGGHIVAVVGWDDQYSRENFTGNPEWAEYFGYQDVEIPKPTADGALIVKNSWGTESGEDGYFYLSYEDAFMMSNNPAIFIADERPDNYNRQYLNDPFGTTDVYRAEGALTASEVFMADDETPELLKAVSFMTGSENTRYEIYVTTGGKTSQLASGIKSYSGYYTEHLDQALVLEKGEAFEISVRLEALDGDEVSVGVSKNMPMAVSGVMPSKNRAFMSVNGERKDCGIEGVYPNIRAFTQNVRSASDQAVIARENMAANAPVKSPSLDAGLNNIEISAPSHSAVSGGYAVNFLTSDEVAIPERMLPERFDLREAGLLTPVRDQYSSNACWTFAATACVESSVAMRGGYAIDHPDGIALSSAQKSVLLTKDQPQQTISLRADLTGSDYPSSARIHWSITGDVDSVRLETPVSMNGETVPVLTALKPGKVTVTAVSDADLSVKANCVITITEQGVEKITLTPEQLNLKAGEKASITAVVEPETAQHPTVLWSSDHPEIASVDENGTVIALSAGKAVITAKAGTAEATAEVNVSGEPAAKPTSAQPKTGLAQNPWSMLIIGALVVTAGSFIVLKKKKEWR